MKIKKIKTMKSGENSWEVPGELTGITQEEAAYVPKADVKPLPVKFFWIAAALLILSFAFAGVWQYRNKILPEKHFKEAVSFYGAGEYAAALGHFNRVLELRPERKDTLFMIGVCLQKLGDLPQALEAFSQDVKYQPQNADAWHNIALILISSDKPEGALVPLEKANKLKNLKDLNIMRLAAQLNARVGSADAAAALYIAAVELNSSDGEALLADSKALMGFAKYHEALRGYERAAAILSGDKRAIYGLNAAKAMLNMPTDEDLTLAPGKSLGKIELGFTMGDVAAYLGEPDEVDTLYAPPQAYELWTYHAPNKKAGPVKFTFDEDGTLIQAETESHAYKTHDGMGTKNFESEQRKSRFEIMQDSEVGLPSYRYALKEGGLTFYIFYNEEGSRSVAVIHKGKKSIYDQNTSKKWIKSK